MSREGVCRKEAAHAEVSLRKICSPNGRLDGPCKGTVNLRVVAELEGQNEPARQRGPAACDICSVNPRNRPYHHHRLTTQREDLLTSLCFQRQSRHPTRVVCSLPHSSHTTQARSSRNENNINIHRTYTHTDRTCCPYSCFVQSRLAHSHQTTSITVRCEYLR